MGCLNSMGLASFLLPLVFSVREELTGNELVKKDESFSFGVM